MDRSARPRVVVVEDDREVATLVTETLNDEGFDAVTAGRHTAAIDVERMHPRLLVLDPFRGHVAAGDVLAWRDRTGARIPLVLLSGAQDLEAEARALGASAFLPKPFEIDDLVRACRGLAP